MPQKPLLKVGKKIDKKNAANRHGKTPQTRKGHFEKTPKKKNVLAQYKDNQELTKMINKQNEANAAGKATQTGGRLSLLKAPPVLAPADKKKKAKATAAADEMDEL